MILDLLLVLACLYTLMMLLLAAAVARAHYPADRSIRPTVSIIIAARDEQDNIGRCLASIAELSYPAHLLEVIIVDDRSTDATQSIVQGYAGRYRHIKLVVAEPESETIRGKTNAVTQGIEASHGSILLFTDADCTVPKGWVEETVKYYTDERIGIVAGFTTLRSANWFEAVQAIDWLVLFSAAAAVIRLNFPVTAVGNNFSVRRKAYDDVGGYRRIPFSVTEDYALFHAVTTRGGYRARFPLDRSSLVISGACRSPHELYRQKKRWFRGGEDMDLTNHLILGAAYLFTLALLVLTVTTGLAGTLIPLLLKTAADLFLALPAAVTFRRTRLLLFFPLFEIYFILYMLVFPLVVLAGQDVIWKERVFEANHTRSK